MRFIWSRARVHVVSPVNASSDGLHICLALVSAALLRVGRRGDLSFHIFTPAFWRVWHLIIVFLMGCIRNTLAFWQKPEDSAPFLRVTISIVLYDAFRRMLWCRQNNFSHNSCVICIFFPIQYPWGCLLLSMGCLIIWSLVWKLSCGIFRRDLVWEVLLCSCTRRLVNSASLPQYSCLMTEKVSTGCFPSLM